MIGSFSSGLRRPDETARADVTRGGKLFGFLPRKRLAAREGVSDDPLQISDEALMRMLWKLGTLVPLLLIGTQTMAAAAPKRPSEKIAGSAGAATPLPSADETACSFIETEPTVRPWEKARVVDGTQIRTAADLAALRGARVIVLRANLAGRRLAGARLTNICFAESNLARTDWRGVRATGLAVSRSDLSGAIMTGAVLPGAFFLDTTLDGVDASRARLRNARIQGGTFDGLSLRDADMTGFDMFCGLIVGDRTCEWPENRGVDARRANLSGAHLNLYLTNDWKFDGAVIDRTVVEYLQVPSFRKADVRGPVILESSGYETGVRVRLNPVEWRQLLATGWSERPAFDCTRARSTVEKLVCRDGEGAGQSDRRLNRLYRAALTSGTTTMAAQRHWLGERDKCSNQKDDIGGPAECVARMYDRRIDELDKSLPAPAWLRRGAEALFISSSAAPPAAFQRTALYARIFPVLVASADSHLFVRVVGHNRIRAGADSWGGNGHNCALGGSVFDFNPTAGRFGAFHSKDWAQGREVNVREDILRLVGDEATVGDGDGGWIGGEYAGCGARAGFDRMTRISIPAKWRRGVAKRGRNLLSNI